MFLHLGDAFKTPFFYLVPSEKGTFQKAAYKANNATNVLVILTKVHKPGKEKSVRRKDVIIDLPPKNASLKTGDNVVIPMTSDRSSSSCSTDKGHFNYVEGTYLRKRFGTNTYEIKVTGKYATFVNRRVTLEFWPCLVKAVQ